MGFFLNDNLKCVDVNEISAVDFHGTYLLDTLGIYSISFEFDKFSQTEKIEFYNNMLVAYGNQSWKRKKFLGAMSQAIMGKVFYNVMVKYKNSSFIIFEISSEDAILTLPLILHYMDNEQASKITYLND